jgi:hypothetical protein
MNWRLSVASGSASDRVGRSVQGRALQLVLSEVWE